MSQYPNWLHSPTHFREHSVALLSRPNVHDLWRVRFRNFLSYGFYLGGLLISLTSFLCFNYSTSWLFCQHFFGTFFIFFELRLLFTTVGARILITPSRRKIFICCCELKIAILIKNIECIHTLLPLFLSFYNYYNIKLIICQAIFYNFFLVLPFLSSTK